jgi:very-short-patch-repair endonuclease
MPALRAVPMPHHEQDLAQWAKGTWHAYTHQEIEALFSRRKLRNALDAGDVVRLAPNAYVGAPHADSIHSQIDAALLWAGRDVAVGGLAALFLYGIVPDPPKIVELVAPLERRLASPPSWISVYRTGVAIHHVQVGHWTAVDPGFAMCQSFGRLSRSDREGILLGALAHKMTTVGELRRALRTLPRVRSRRALVSVVERFAQGHESFLEWWSTENVFTGREFDRFVKQHTIVAGQMKYRVDMYDERTRTVVEIDGAAYHSSPADWQRDLRRDTDIASLGIQTVRFSYRDLRDRPEWCRERLLAVLAARDPGFRQR